MLKADLKVEDFSCEDSVGRRIGVKRKEAAAAAERNGDGRFPRLERSRKAIDEDIEAMIEVVVLV